MTFYEYLTMDYWCREKLEGKVGTLGRKGKP